MHIWRELNIQIVFTEFSVTLKISCTDFIKKKKKKENSRAQDSNSAVSFAVLFDPL